MKSSRLAIDILICNEVISRIRTVLLSMIFLFSFLSSSKAQDIEVVHGISISYGFPKKSRILVTYNAYLRSHFEIKKDFAYTPFLDIKVSLFRNHLGSNLKKKYSALAYFNTSFTFGNLLSFDEIGNGDLNYVPTFTSTYHNTPNSSYRNNVGVGSTRSYQFALGNLENADVKHAVLSQQVSNVMLSVHDFYLTYFNDGGDPLSNYFGDGKDRYWTAGLSMGYFIKTNNEVHQAELSFDQFTGYNKFSYETAGLLHVNNVLYSDLEQFGYNTGRVSLKYLNLTSHVGGAINLWNIGIQDMIHKYVTSSPFHSRIEKRYVDFEIYWNQNFNVNED